MNLHLLPIMREKTVAIIIVKITVDAVAASKKITCYCVTQNDVRPVARSYVPPEIAEDDIRLVIYHCITIINKNSNNVKV